MDSLQEVQEVFERLAFESEYHGNSITLKVGGVSHPFPAVVTKDEEKGNLVVTCQVGKIGDIGDDEAIARFAVAALDANTRIRPFSFGTITDTDDPSHDDENEWPIVLINSIPMGDLQDSELDSLITSLTAAILTSADVFKIPVAAPAA